MGTHPIFESDFDCLTDCLKSDRDKKIFEKMSSAAAESVSVTIRWRPFIKRELENDESPSEWTFDSKTISTFQEKIQNAKEMEELKESYASKISDLDAKLASFGNAKQAEALMNQIAPLNAHLKDRAHQINQLEEKVMNPYF